MHTKFFLLSLCLVTSNALLSMDKTVTQTSLVNTSNNSEQQLIEAALKGDKQTCSRLLQEGTNINAKDEKGNTALINATENGHINLIQFLCDQPHIDINAKGQLEFTAFAVAVHEGQKEIVELLLAKPGIDVNARDKNQTTALIVAAAQNRKEIIQLLLNTFDIDVNVANRLGHTALMAAAFNKSINAVQLLLTKPSIDVNRTDCTGKTALIHAARTGAYEIVGLLLNQPSIAINARDKRISKDLKAGTALMYAVAKGYTSIAKLLLSKAGIDVNIQNEDGDTVLMVAAIVGDQEIVQMLLERADVIVDSKDCSGKTALMHAIEAEHKKIAELLFAKQYGSMTEKSDDKARVSLISESALVNAAREGHKEIVRLLLNTTCMDTDDQCVCPQNDMDQIKQVEREGRTPLASAAFSSLPPEMLLEVMAYAGWRQDLSSLLKTIASLNKTGRIGKKAMHMRCVLDKMLFLSDIGTWAECREFLLKLLLAQPHVSVVDKFRLGWLISMTEGRKGKNELSPWFDRFVRGIVLLPRFCQEKKQLIEHLPGSLSQLVEASKNDTAEEIQKCCTIFGARLEWGACMQTKSVESTEDVLHFLEQYCFSCLPKSALWPSLSVVYDLEETFPVTSHVPSERYPTALFVVVENLPEDEDEDEDGQDEDAVLAEIVHGCDINAQNMDGDTFAHLVFRKNMTLFVNFFASLYPAVEVNLALPNKKGERAISYLCTVPFNVDNQKALRHFARMAGVDFSREQLKSVGPVLGPIMSRTHNHDREAITEAVLELDEQQGKMRFRVAAWYIQNRESSFGTAARIILGWRLALRETSEERVNAIFSQIELLKKTNAGMRLDVPRLLLEPTQLKELRLYVRSLIVDGKPMKMNDPVIKGDPAVAQDVLSLLTLETKNLRSLACLPVDEEKKEALSRRLIEVCSSGGPEMEKDVVQLIIEGADQAFCDNTGITAVLCAAIRHDYSLIKLLLSMSRFFPGQFSPQAFQMLVKNSSAESLKQLFNIWDLRKVKDTRDFPFVHYMSADLHFIPKVAEACPCEATSCVETRKKLQGAERRASIWKEFENKIENEHCNQAIRRMEVENAYLRESEESKRPEVLEDLKQKLAYEYAKARGNGTALYRSMWSNIF